MLLFLARIGRKPWAKTVVPGIGLITSMTYVYSLHYFGLNKIKNFLVAQSPSGQIEELSDDLKELIVRVFRELEPNYKVPWLKKIAFKPTDSPMRWFCSATVDPVTFGMSGSTGGSLIGIPPNYNLKSVNEFSGPFRPLRKFKLFKSSGELSEQDKEEQDALRELGYDPQDSKFMSNKKLNLDGNHEHVLSYINSQVLSEDAKKFSIAREIFMTDNYRPLAKAAAMLGSSLVPVAIHRHMIEFAALHEGHITRRIPIYMFSFSLGVLSLRRIFDLIDYHFIMVSDERAMSLGESYRTGAIEYFSKVIERNKALREIYPEMQGHFDEEGNVRRQFYKLNSAKLTDRLKKAEEFSCPSTSKQAKAD